MANIEFRGVTKRYADGTEAITKLDLGITHGELMVLVGPSGCGKSTALRMIAGLEEITEGELLIGNELINERPPKERNIAMVFQNYALYPHMTVRENMGFALRFAKVDKQTIAQKVDQAARILDLTAHLDRKPAHLSGGQRQRVAMGRAIVRDPAVFLMDEPLSNLDAKLRVQMRIEITRIQSQLGTTMVYVTHDQTEAMTLGDRLAVMRDGVLQQVGIPRDLYNEPANMFVAGFIGSPAMNFMPAEVYDDRLQLPFGDVPTTSTQQAILAGLPKDGSLVVGIRPEDFEDAALVGDQRERGTTFRIRADVLEDVGAETYMYFDVRDRVRRDELVAIARDIEEGDSDAEFAPARTGQVVARIGSETRAIEGQPLDLWLDLAKLRFFDLRTGRAL